MPRFVEHFGVPVSRLHPLNPAGFLDSLSHFVTMCEVGTSVLVSPVGWARVIYLMGGAYWIPPALHSWLRPRGMPSFEPAPTLRS